MKLFKYSWTIIGLIMAITGTYLSLYGHGLIKKIFDGSIAVQLIRLVVYGILLIIIIIIFFFTKTFFENFLTKKRENRRKEKVATLLERKASEKNSVIRMLVDIYLKGGYGITMLKYAQILLNDKDKLATELNNPAIRNELDEIKPQFKLPKNYKTNDNELANEYSVIRPLLLAMISGGLLTYDNEQLHIDPNFKHDFDELMQLIEKE